MAVANPWLQKGWDEWKREMEENKRKRLIWMGRVMRWANLEVICEEEGEEEVEEESDAEEEEEEGINGKEEKVSKEEEVENETDEKEGGDKAEKAEKRERGREHMEEPREVSQVEEQEDKMESEEVDDVEDKESGEMEEEEEEEEEEGENEEEREVKENEVDGEESMVVKGEEQIDEEEKECENEGKEEEGKEGLEIEEEEEVKEGNVVWGEENEGETESEEDDEMGDNRMKCEEQEEEGEEEEEEEEQQQEREQNEEFHLEQQDEHVQQNQETTEQEETALQVDENLDSVESDNFSQNSDLMGSEDEEQNNDERQTYNKIKDGETHDEKLYEDGVELEDPLENSLRMASKERKEDDNGVKKLADDEKAVTESSTTYDEEFQDYLLHEEEEESTDDDDDENAATEEDTDDQNEVKIYCKDDHPTDIFHTLNEFRDSFLLTDLILNTVDGKGLHVHSIILAAVSSYIRKIHDRRNQKQYTNTGNEVHIHSVSLGPEVDRVGLEAVVEFSYTGVISHLNSGAIEKIKTAAQTLGAPRVLDVCIKEEKESSKTGDQKREGKMSAEAQLKISLQSIKQLWMDRVGCDVILEALGASLQVHRVILAASSDYFRGMFTLGMKESNQQFVNLPFLLASELEALIGCSYSGALPLSWSCVFEITSTALQLQYQSVLSLCLNFLQQEINPNSCLDVASFADAYGMVQLLEVAEDFVLRQFQKVACTSKFKDLPAKQLLKYLNSLSLCVPSELVVFRAVVAWIQAKPKKRLRLTKELMKTIRFPLMTLKEFREVQNQEMWSEHSLRELFDTIFEDYFSTEDASQSQCRIYLPKESVVLIGGDQISEDLGNRSISRELWFGNSLRNHMGIKKAMEWRKLGEMPDPARFSHEVAVLKGQLYVIGGKKYYGVDDTLSSAYRYDPIRNSWETLAQMQERRYSFSVVVLDGKIYAIGGHCDPEYRESVEQYCPTTNSWRFTCPLDLPLSGHATKVLQGLIFISGGLNNDYRCLASTFLYHPETGSNFLENMSKPRAYHCMETLGDCLYVAGGMTTYDNMILTDQLGCEMYNPAADSWTSFPPLSVPHVGAGSAVLEGKFYVLGGYSQEDYSDTKMVHRYDPATQQWENMGKMPGPNNDIRAAVLCLPAHFRL